MHWFESFRLRVVCFLLLAASFTFAQQPAPAAEKVFGFHDFSKQAAVNKTFLAVPDAKRAEEHLRILTAEPHIAGSIEDKKTADYVAARFREAGLETEIVEYKIWMNLPGSIKVSMTAPAGVKMEGPAREKVDGDRFQADPRVPVAFNGYSPSGMVEADVVYANYGSPADFDKLAEMKIDVRGKIAIVRYGNNFRGVKTYVAQERGAAGVLIYSDPIDDGYFKGDKYPKGPWRPDTGVQRGSILYLFKYPGDPTTPGVASTPQLKESERIAAKDAASLATIPTTPLSYSDATPIMQHLGGPESPREWQGALPFTYHLGPGPAKVKINVKQDYAFRTIWNVIGTIKGSELPDEWVVAGNHRDAWVYGAVDPNSGTAAMLEAVSGLGALLKTGWRPRRTIVFGSWDAEEQGLVGSTEWVEQHEKELAGAVAYFNLDVAVSGPTFGASAVPSMKQFVRDVTRFVPAAKGGGTVYEVWKQKQKSNASKDEEVAADLGGSQTRPPAAATADVLVGDLGSGSDYTPFFQHAGIPSTDIGSNGNYGVYHSVFDNFDWFKKFADPDFTYTQQMARVLGIEVLHMAGADVLPLDYKNYGEEVTAFLTAAQKRSRSALKLPLDFTAALTAAKRFTAAGAAIRKAQDDPAVNTKLLNKALRDAERAMLLADGLPKRPWFRHAIFAPGEYTGYAAVVIPGVNEALDAKDEERARVQMARLVEVLNRSAQVLEGFAAAPKM